MKRFLPLVAAVALGAGLVLWLAPEEDPREAPVAARPAPEEADTIPDRSAEAEPDSSPLLHAAETEIDSLRVPVASGPQRANPPRKGWFEARFVDAETMEPIQGVRVRRFTKLATMSAQRGNTTMLVPLAPKPEAKDPEVFAESDADGRVHFAVWGKAAGKPSPVNWLCTEREGYARFVLYGWLHPKDTTWLGEIALERGRTVAGRVRVESGAPLDDVRVIVSQNMVSAPEPFHDPAQREHGLLGHRALRQVQPRADGTFRILGLEANQRYTVWACGPQSRWDWVDLPRRTPSEDVALTLRPWTAATISGEVRTATGEPLQAWVGLLPEEQLRPTIAVASDADGTFTLPCPEDKPCTVVAKDLGGDWLEARVEKVEPGTQDVVLELQRARTLAVVVRDTTGAPVRWPRVDVQNSRTGPSIHMAQGKGRGIAFLPMPSQKFHLTVNANGYRAKTFGPFRGPLVEHQVVCTLEAGLAVAGRVTFQGHPVRDAKVTVHRSHEPGRGWRVGAKFFEWPFAVQSRAHPVSGGFTDDEGRFRISKPSSEWIVVRVEAAGYAPAVTAPLSAEASVLPVLDIEMRRAGALIGRLVPPADKSADEYYVAVSRGDGIVFSRPVDADGEFRLTGLTPGPWQVRATPLSLEPIWQLHVPKTYAGDAYAPLWDVDVRIGSTARFDIDLSDRGGFTLVGRVDTGRETQTFSGDAAISFLGADGAPQYLTSARVRRGNFKLKVSRPGTYLLTLTRGTYVHGQTLYDLVTLARGTNHWSASFEESGLVASWSTPKKAGVLHRWRGPNSLQIFTPVKHGMLRDFPVGYGQLVEGKLQRDEPPRLPSADWPVLRDVEVRSGENLQIDLP